MPDEASSSQTDDDEEDSRPPGRITYPWSEITLYKRIATIYQDLNINWRILEQKTWSNIYLISY